MDHRMRVLFWIATAGTVVLALANGLAFPPEADLAPGWSTPIIAFELARTPADVAFLAGPGAEPLRAAMDRGHRVDAVFPFFYAWVLGLSLARLGPTPRRFAPAVALVVPADLWENHTLVALTDALRRGAPVDDLLATLVIATWAKWGLIGAGLGGFAIAGWRRHPWAAVVCAAAALMVPTAALTARPAAGEVMALAVGIGFLNLIATGLRAAARPHVPPPSSTAPPGG